jgi:hypothetical protein
VIYRALTGPELSVGSIAAMGSGGLGTGLEKGEVRGTSRSCRTVVEGDR